MRAGSGWTARRSTWRVVSIVVALAAAAIDAGAQSTTTGVRLPFFVGERLDYRVQVGRLGNVGHTTMRVDAPDTVAGRAAWVLRFDFRAKVGPIGAVDQSASWFDPLLLAALRFQKHEKHPLSKHDERVELDLATHRWTGADGATGTMTTDAPLDELSFMYVLRTLPLDGDSVIRLARHFDAARNPTSVRVLGRRTVTTGAGTFRTIQVEMRVVDPRRYKGEGVILLDLTDDHCRLPVRIESVMPKIGRTTMTLEVQNHPADHHLARAE